MSQTRYDFTPIDDQSPAMITVIKTLGDKEPFDYQKLEVAITKAVGISRKSTVVSDIIRFVESKLDFTSSNEITSGFINVLIEAYLLKKAQKDKLYNTFLKKYVDNRIKKQHEYAVKVSHLYAIIKHCKHMSSLKKYTSNQTQIASARYLLKDLDTGELKESIEEWYYRVASVVVLGSILYDPRIYNIKGDSSTVSGSLIYSNFNVKNLKSYHVNIIKEFYGRYINHMKLELDETVRLIDSELWDKYAELLYRYKGLMLNGVFMPNTPTLMNAGSGSGGLSACFTLDVEDNMASIADKWTSAAFIYKMAGGLGVNVSKVRPSGSPVSDTYGAATGPINLVLEAIDKVTDIVKSGGKRRGANMGIMEYWHPQIFEFIDYKTTPGVLENFNISVMFDEQFWHSYFRDNEFIVPYHKGMEKIVSYPDLRFKPHDLIDKVAEHAWASAEPGVLFKDNMNKKNPLRKIWGDIHITNPCSEQAMYSGESCTLGSINLARFVDLNGEFNFTDFKKIVRLTSRFLNDVLEVNHYPTEYIQSQSEKTKRIGLGIMGFADMLFKMRIRFNSKKAYALTYQIAETLYWESIAESKTLAEERGPCEAFLDLVKKGVDPKEIVNRVYQEKTFHSSMDYMQGLDKGVRNAWTTTIAPTGTISMIADCSNGLEPIFALVYKKTVSTGDHYYLNEEFKNALIQEGIYDDEIVKKVEANAGSCQGMEEIPKWMQDVFVTAMDMHWTDHIVSQAIWQQHIDNSISKTINMPHNATPSDIKYAYILAHELGLKGISIYRDGSREKQVLHTNTSVSSDNGATIGVKAIVNETIEKKSEPSEATLEYIQQNIQSDVIKNDFQVIVLKSAMQPQLFIKEKEECPSCHKGVLVNTAGCTSCNLCGYSLSCAIG